MTVGLDDGKFFLRDNWPGPISHIPHVSAAALTQAYASEIAAGTKVGTKIAIYQPTNKGFAIFNFLKYEKGTAAAATIKSLCTQDTSEVATASQYYVVTNDGGESAAGGPAAVALCTLADGEYAWFWVGGVVPVDTISGLDGIHPSDGNVTAQKALVAVDSASVNKFGLFAGSLDTIPIGWADAADTTS